MTATAPPSHPPVPGEIPQILLRAVVCLSSSLSLISLTLPFTPFLFFLFSPLSSHPSFLPFSPIQQQDSPPGPCVAIEMAVCLSERNGR